LHSAPSYVSGAAYHAARHIGSALNHAACAVDDNLAGAP
jgi:hypothetical protein